MFSKYFGMNIPPNYSGSRFSSIEKTETKLHRPDMQMAVKSSLSPSFSPSGAVNESFVYNDIDDETGLDVDEVFDDANDNFGEENIENCSLDAKKEDCENETHERGKLGFDIHSLRSLFSGIEKDELIIIALIILLITDEGKENDEIISVLTLLLLSGKILG